MAKQIAIRIPDELAKDLEALVEEEGYPTMAEAVRVAVRELAERKRREKADRAIIEGYRRQPPTQAEEEWIGRAGREFIAEEPW